VPESTPCFARYLATDPLRDHVRADSIRPTALPRRVAAEPTSRCKPEPVLMAAGMQKKNRNAGGTREKLLLHATAEFAARGYDGARVHQISHRCGVSKNMLYHYFKSKEGLFIAVLERMYETLRARQGELALDIGDPSNSMRRLIADTFSALLECPEIIALLNSENLHKGRHVQQSSKIRNLYDPLVDTITRVLRAGVEQGVFRPRIDPIKLYISLSSLAYHYISNQYTLKAAFGIDFNSDARRREWLAHITDMILVFCQSSGDPAGRGAKHR
jgi:TetR/AcrR family transcriptional regulator